MQAQKGGESVSPIHSSLCTRKEVGGQYHASAILPLEKPGISCTGDWVALRHGLDSKENPIYIGIRFPDISAHGESLCRHSYNGCLCSDELLLLKDQVHVCVSWKRDLIIWNKEIGLLYLHSALVRRQNTRFIAYGWPCLLVEQLNALFYHKFKSFCVYICPHLSSSVIECNCSLFLFSPHGLFNRGLNLGTCKRLFLLWKVKTEPMAHLIPC